MSPSPAHAIPEPPSSGVVHASFKKGEILRAGNQAFRLTRCLGLGAMGEVYEVEDQNLGVTRVMKLLRPDLSATRPHLVDRFLREARCLAKLRHPSVVGVVLADRLPDGTPFYAMEYVAGRSLSAFLGKHAPLEPRVALPILLQLASALDAVHGAGIVHRDIKCDNVLVWRERDGIRATLLDFGVMKLLSDEVHEGFCGTPRYAAPEQLRGELPTVKIDIFALGIVAFQMLSRRDPYEDYDSPVHRIERPAPLLSDTPGAKRVSDELVMLIADMLALEPSKRPTARQIADRLAATPEATNDAVARPLRDDELTSEELMSISPLHAAPIHAADLDAHTLPGAPPQEILEAARRALAPTVRGQTVQGVGLEFREGEAVGASAVVGKGSPSDDFDIAAQALLIAERAAARMAEARIESAIPNPATAPLPGEPARPRDTDLLNALADKWRASSEEPAPPTALSPVAGRVGAPLVVPPAGPARTVPLEHRPLPGKGRTVPLAPSSSRRAPTPAEAARAVALGRAEHAAREERRGAKIATMIMAGIGLAIVVLAVVLGIILRGTR